MENILLQPKDLIKQRRETLGLTQKEFAYLLNLKESGDRTISGWERGEHSPTAVSYTHLTLPTIYSV